MATKFSPCKGSYVLNQFPSNVMFGMNGFHVSISQWSDTGPSWPSCLILLAKNFIHVLVKCNITKKLSFMGLKFGIGKPLQSINYKL